jgi:hypothetical protein
MPLYAVERDLCDVTPEQLRLRLSDVLRVCRQVSLQGRKVRYIGIPAERRGICLFGAEDPEWVREVQDASRISYCRIVPVLDLTPNHVDQQVSRRRRPVHDDRAHSYSEAGDGAMNSDPAQDIARWFEEGQRVFRSRVERIERLEQLQLTLEREKEQLRRTMIQVEHDNEILRTQREELLAAFEALAGNVTQVVDEVLQRFRREDRPDRGDDAR